MKQTQRGGIDIELSDAEDEGSDSICIKIVEKHTRPILESQMVDFELLSPETPNNGQG